MTTTGPQAFQAVYDHLSTHTDGARYQYCMVGYQLQNTVTENGSVSRGMCQVGPDGMLQSVTERTRIVQRDGLIQYARRGTAGSPCPASTTVSMGLWGLGASFLAEAEAPVLPLPGRRTAPKPPQMRILPALRHLSADRGGQGPAQGTAQRRQVVRRHLPGR